MINLNLQSFNNLMYAQYLKLLFYNREKPTVTFSLPVLQSHRGYWVSGIKENTLAAILEAQKQHAKMVEFDIRLSKDGVLFLNHDADLVRIWGVSRRLCDCHSTELKVLGLSTLEEVIKKTSVKLNIEIKSEKIESDGVEEKLAQLIARYDLYERVVVSSFNPFVLIRLKKIDSLVARALLVARRKHEQNKLYLRWMMLAPVVQPQFVHMYYEDIDAAMVKALRPSHVKIVAWTVNDSQRITQLLKMGVSSIISDKYVSEESL